MRGAGRGIKVILQRQNLAELMRTSIQQIENRNSGIPDQFG
jgi:hypothetical protein